MRWAREGKGEETDGGAGKRRFRHWAREGKGEDGGAGKHRFRQWAREGKGEEQDGGAGRNGGVAAAELICPPATKKSSAVASPLPPIQRRGWWQLW